MQKSLRTLDTHTELPVESLATYQYIAPECLLVCLFCCELEWPRLLTVTLCPCLCVVALLCGRVEDCYRDQSMLSVLFG